MNSLPLSLKNTLGILTTEKCFVLAVSGGIDSLALLRLMVELKETEDYRLVVAHVDHQLREESAQDAAFVADLCQRLGLQYQQSKIPVAEIAKRQGLNLEEAARKLRYQFLYQVAKRENISHILTAHTLDDQAETVLMQLLRGAAFLKGMPAKQGKVLRPLLGISRQELAAYLQALGQEHRHDVTNDDNYYQRAWLRNVILPQLELRHPYIKTKLAQLAEIQLEQQKHFNALISLFQRDDAYQLHSLLKADIATQRHVIAHSLSEQGLAPDFGHIEAIREALDTDHQRLSLAKGYQARLAYGQLKILSPDVHQATGTSHLIKLWGIDVWDETLEDLSEDVFETIDPEKLKHLAKELGSPLQLRYRQAGDRMRLSFGTKKLSDLLIDRKIPRERRDSLRVLAIGLEVLWLEGVACDVRIAKEGFKGDSFWLRVALEEAEKAFALGEVPVGAVLVHESKLIARAHNLTETLKDATAHAEVLVLREAGRMLGDWRLNGGVVYVTLEPCPMCLGAMLEAHLNEVVYSAPNPREGALGGLADLQSFPWKRRLKVRQGPYQQRASQLLKDFFAQRRPK
ncbi:MAG: tRNA lysidine(34) synthetase TilS [Deinococcales bacterium]